jgi:ABC-type sugar transport system substrate-binding protein
MKKVIAIMIVMVLLSAFVAGCSNSGTVESESAAASASAPAETASAESSTAAPAAETEAAAGSADGIKIGYLAKNMSIQWIQNMEAATKELSEQYGFEFVVADAESTAEKQMTQMQTFISDGVDGVAAKKVLQRLADVGADVYQTSRAGTIIATSDGKAVTFNAVPSPPQKKKDKGK